MQALTQLRRAEAILCRNPLQNAYPLLRIAQGRIADCAVMGNSVRLLDEENGKTLYCADSLAAFCV